MQLVRVAKMSHLALIPGTTEFKQSKKDLESTLQFVHTVMVRASCPLVGLSWTGCVVYFYIVYYMIDCARKCRMGFGQSKWLQAWVLLN